MTFSRSTQNGHVSVRYIPLSYNHADSQASALRLVLALRPEWEHAEGKIEFVRFTDGITNTTTKLLKIIRRAPGMTDEEIDNESVLMRAYGNHTEVLIDREKEVRSHALLASKGLAPPLLARFRNGLLYRFIRGQVASPHDLTQPRIWRGIARRLAQWHAVLPISDNATNPAMSVPLNGHAYPLDFVGEDKKSSAEVKDDIIPVRTQGQEGPTLWTVLQKWILALPCGTDKERKRRKQLQKEFERIVAELDDRSGLGHNGLVFAHCDLLCANVVMQPKSVISNAPEEDSVETVSFIDYEYATPSPAAFDIANHFAEWGGYDCDYNMMPTRAVRRGFLTEYVQSYSKYADLGNSQEEAVEKLFQDVDRFRGIPGFYWGVWALIQATISQIDFDYATYAEERLGEYWAWRREVNGARAKSGEEMPLRERRWAQEV
ncbi:ethanolamine kinase [Emydomyces testavorans]|uniref:ethanolamine kinase n=1 Tax=Emydomyces testavorans TaxID=2070801 RepID=A0AAF0DD53_9EURO|nr:ethanolamine kinase [Emydomyces testavorans]